MGINEIFFNYLMVSIFASIIILLNLVLSRFFSRRYSARMKYCIWLIIAFYLLIPIRLQSRQPSLNLVVTNKQEVSFYNDLTKQEYKIAKSKPEIEKGNGYGSTNFENSKQNHWNLTRIVVYLWFLGMEFAILLETVKYIYTLRIIKIWSVRTKNKEIQVLCDQIKNEMGIKKNIGIFISKRICSPMLCGFVKTNIYLPKDEWDFKELEYILKHELTHYKRRDLWYKLFIHMAVIIHWYNPFVYLMQRYASINIECCCDDTMLKGESYEYRRAYSEVILNNMEAQNINYLTTAFTGGVNEMKQRFENILSMKKRKRGIIPIFGLIFLLFVMGSFVGCSFKESAQKATSNEIIAFTENFVNEFQGAIAGQNAIDLNQYISNDNLKTFADNMIQLTSKQLEQGATMVIYSNANKFTEEENTELSDSLYYIKLQIESGGSGIPGQFLVKQNGNELDIVDFYFGTMDGIDTYCTGHMSERKIEDEKLWDNKEWNNKVQNKLNEYENVNN